MAGINQQKRIIMFFFTESYFVNLTALKILLESAINNSKIRKNYKNTRINPLFFSGFCVRIRIRPKSLRIAIPCFYSLLGHFQSWAGKEEVEWIIIPCTKKFLSRRRQIWGIWWLKFKVKLTRYATFFHNICVKTNLIEKY